MFLLANHGQPWRWREEEIFWWSVGEAWRSLWWKLGEENGRLEKVVEYGGKKMKLVVEGKGKKENRKRKRKWKSKIFSWKRK